MHTGTSRKMILWFFLALFLVSGIMLGWMLLPFLSTIVMALVVTGLFARVYQYVNRKLKAGPASFVTCILIFLILFVPMMLFGGIVFNEAVELVRRARSAVLSEQVGTLLKESWVIERANDVLARFDIEVSGDEFKKGISQLGIIVGRFLVEQTQTIATNILAFFVNVFFMLLIVYFLLIDGHKLIAFIQNLSPLPEEQDDKLISKFKDMVGAILIGNGFCGLIQGVLGGSVFAIFGFNSPFLWGVIMSFLAFLPIIGIGMVFVPAALYLFLTDRVGSGIFFLVFYVILSGGVEYIVKPKLVGDRIQMHTLLVFLSIVGGLKLFGILGIIYGPIVVTAFLTLADIYQTSYREMVEHGS